MKMGTASLRVPTPALVTAATSTWYQTPGSSPFSTVERTRPSTVWLMWYRVRVSLPKHQICEEHSRDYAYFTQQRLSHILFDVDVLYCIATTYKYIYTYKQYTRIKKRRNIKYINIEYKEEKDIRYNVQARLCPTHSSYMFSVYYLNYLYAGSVQRKNNMSGTMFP